MTLIRVFLIVTKVKTGKIEKYSTKSILKAFSIKIEKNK